ncbi:phosphate acetyltransferase [bacterium]
MDLLRQIRDTATEKKKHIVLPEGEDDRMIQAAERLVQDRICQVTILGVPHDIRRRAKDLTISLENVQIINPQESNQFAHYSDRFFQLRQHKGITQQEARKIIAQPLYFGAMMVEADDADGSVAGAVNTTGNVLRAGIQCIGLAENISIVSSIFLMIVPEWEKPITFADGAVVPDPDPDQLANIAIASAQTHQRITGEEPFVAMLSFSTFGSADHPLVDKVKRATEIVKELKPELKADGELQLDAALIPSIGSKKAPESPVAGRANVLIFPDLNSGNIGYKLTQRLANAEAIGPIIQGLRKPANDLSRGCSVEDIVNVAAICSLLSD